MKYLSIIMILALFLAACTAVQDTTQDTNAEVMEEDTMDDTDASDVAEDTTEMEEDHIGCQEDEIDVNGNCVPAEENNAALFGQDLDSYVDSEEINGGVTGFLAKPKEAGNYPGVVMIHEWWGLNDNIREMAKILAKEGYVVFAIDLYDGEVADTSARAGELASSVRSNPAEAIMKMKNAVEYLKEVQGAEKIASLGWCFGGQQSLNLALNDELDATVIYYGSLTDDPEELSNIDWPVLGIFGEEDSSIPVNSVKSFESSLDDLGIQNDIYIYSGVGHAFANPSGSNYAADETKDAWTKTTEFLAANLQPAMMESQPDVTIVLTGENFKFVMDGVNNPELTVSEGDLVRIEFTSTDGFHDWVVDEFDAATERVTTDGTTAVEFVADQTGTFEYYCSVGSHRANGMWGNLVVE